MFAHIFIVINKLVWPSISNTSIVVNFTINNLYCSIDYMKPNLIPTPLKDLFVLELKRFGDERGYFFESWHKKDFQDTGLNVDFVQENQSGSKKGVLRGLHYQDTSAPLVKLVRCVHGEIFDVAIDLRVHSETFGKWFGITLSAENMKQLYVPIGFAHGFVTTSDYAEILYKQTGYYDPSAEGGIIWNDTDLSIKWPVENPILSEKDKECKSLKEYIKNPVFNH